jgi:hypothetical protein
VEAVTDSYLSPTDEHVVATPAAAPPARQRRRGRGRVSGVARQVKLRAESRGRGGSVQVLSMRADAHDERGNRIASVPLELRGPSLVGGVSDGELVEARGRWRRGVLHARVLHNRTTGGAVHARSGRWRVVALTAVGVVIFGAASAVIVQVVRSAPVTVHHRGGGGGGPQGSDGGGPGPSPQPSPDPDPEPVVVPALAGLSQADATARLAQTGLLARAQERDSGDTPGTVIETDPPAGTRVDRGATVVLQVARRRIEVPDLVGADAGAAATRLGTLDLVPGLCSVPDARDGIVTAQRPAAGERVPPGTTVTLRVATSAPPGGEPYPPCT